MDTTCVLHSNRAIVLYVYTCISSKTFPQVNVCRLSIDDWRNTEFLLSEHIEDISERSSIPIL